MEEDKKYERAKKRVINLKAFYIHLIVYILVNTLLVILNLMNYEDVGRWWFVYPLLGWGIGLVFHGLSVAPFGLFRPDWEERKIKEYMKKDNRND
ncbi:2TM domain-containing protein [Radiobacillus kanasensis]|uniref:2TM domain-containing protein n=1 Tax=Radiobacillus kanasensis TaxID=2844358 RepID=UPI001E5B8C0D|nr:2TM domain-containing protein [Radiobacillus kanasensis]UFT99846.1 2TM domain-containing protein [Radiobacillus kanasensis]